MELLMPTAQSKKYPALYVYTAGVRFRNGVPVDADGKPIKITEEQAAKLRRLPTSSGVTVNPASAPRSNTDGDKKTGDDSTGKDDGDKKTGDDSGKKDGPDSDKAKS